MDKISTMSELENIFQEAKKKDAKYVMVKIAMQGFEKPEVIVNPKENIDSKLEYYKKAYKEDLHLKTFDGIQIVEAGYINNIQEEKAWEDFRETGLLWFINTILHVFGWAIVVYKNNKGDIYKVKPTRVTWRGFSEESNEKGYKNVTKFLSENIEDLLKEVDQ